MKKQVILFFSFLFLNTLHIQAQKLVLPGDYPDPSVTKIGDTYWASATTSNWFPAYPLLQSKDLVNWQTAGYVFNQMPGWVDYYFWAPEISYENGKVYVYYSAHKKNGNLCLGVASADRPEGPYRDHGPLMCEEAGSIDAFPMRDENGKLYMIWKEDGNSVKKPTPIWAMPMNEERTALVGEKKELFRNDAPWEANLVEGVSMMRHGGYIYAFYAAAGCCGTGCTYGTGIARAKSLLGPWEKYPGNPVLTHTKQWKCPGHGTPVEKDGKFYFLYHAYDTKSHVFTGRQGLLMEFTFTPDGWIKFLPSETSVAAVSAPAVTDEFEGDSLSHNWQWNVFQTVNYDLKKGCLFLNALPEPVGAFLGQKTYWSNYEATTMVNRKKSTAAAGIAAIGDEKNMVRAQVKGNNLQVITVINGKETEVAQKEIGKGKEIYVQMQVQNGKDISFFYSNNGRDFQQVNSQPVDGAFLPPWDRAVRAGLTSQGNTEQIAVFEKFTLKEQ